MVDILASGDFGRDDGIKCNRMVVVNTSMVSELRECGGKTFLIFDEEPPKRSASEEATIDEWINFARDNGAGVFENSIDPSEWYIALYPVSEGDRKIF